MSILYTLLMKFAIGLCKILFNRVLMQSYHCRFKFYSSVSDCISNVNLAPSLKAYSKIAASARLIYSLQQSWNFSKISFCSSVKVFSKSSWCLAIYPRSSFISFEFVLLSSCGMMLPCHSSLITLFMIRDHTFPLRISP